MKNRIDKYIAKRDKRPDCRIVLSGGGTLGSVIPLLALENMVRQERPEVEFSWIITRKGPENEFIRKYYRDNGLELDVYRLATVKLRRYFSLENIRDMIKAPFVLIYTISLLAKLRPDIVITAGGFVSVPVHIAAKFFGIKSWVHQQDVLVGLSNKIMARSANLVTSVFPLDNISNQPVEKIGNFISNYQAVAIDEKWHDSIRPNLPVILVTGGGLGADRINQLVFGLVDKLSQKANIFHQTGKENYAQSRAYSHKYPTYHSFQHLARDEFQAILEMADLVVGRGGLSTLTEIATFAKPSIIITKQGHQTEYNAKYLDQLGAIVWIKEEDLDSDKLLKIIEDLIKDQPRRVKLASAVNQSIDIADQDQVTSKIDELLSK
ncbi:glycosyltransferase [Candidatus Saccharibacteria bacterium]|nr:glycosyltransferase [Candidatus Saccharibacteria bacterium]MCB9834414.1 glycosyltransferase [Candidatus Nomurabacteria bacterium]